MAHQVNPDELSYFERGLIGIALEFSILAVEVDMFQGDQECKIDRLYGVKVSGPMEAADILVPLLVENGFSVERRTYPRSGPISVMGQDAVIPGEVLTVKFHWAPMNKDDWLVAGWVSCWPGHSQVTLQNSDGIDELELADPDSCDRIVAYFDAARKAYIKEK